MMMGFGVFGLLIVLLFFVLVIGAAIALVSLLFPRPGNPANHNQATVSSNAALEILKQRYARGELTKEEYETMKEDILAA